jgi:hypothetical protein
MIFGVYCSFAARWIEAERQLEAEGLLARGSTGNTIAHPLFKIAIQSAREMIRPNFHFLRDRFLSDQIVSHFVSHYRMGSSCVEG